MIYTLPGSSILGAAITKLPIDRLSPYAPFGLSKV